MTTTIKLTLTPEDLNVILVSLSNLPYRQVYDLIERIQQEAGAQLQSAARESEPSIPKEEQPSQ